MSHGGHAHAIDTMIRPGHSFASKRTRHLPHAVLSLPPAQLLNAHQGEAHMKSGRLTSILAVILVAMALPVSLAAQANAKQNRPHQYHHYQINDVGTFGGPWAFLNQTSWGRAGILNNHGTLAGAADTLTVDPYCIDSPDCYAAHAFRWHNGVTADLGTLPGGIGSQVNWLSASGLAVGISDNGQQDPLQGGPEIHAVLWKPGDITDLGNLPDGGYQSWAYAVNNRGEVVGQAYNTIPDPNSFYGYGYQSRAFYWKDGVMQDLGTLGTGSDSDAISINNRGQVVGVSYVNSIPSALCSGVQLGFVFTTGSFIWDKKNGMQDIGSLGGTCTVAYDLNNRGQVVGQSSQLGDPTTLAFVWDATTGIKQLPTAANLYGAAFAVDDAGEIVGLGDAPDGQASATLWRKTGGKWKANYLGRLHSGDCAVGVSINASRQVVGISGPNGCSTTLPFLWEDGGRMVDLNTLVPANSGIQLVEAQQINDRGEIAAEGPDANGNNHAVLLIPCDESHPGVEGCDYDLTDAAAAASRLRPAPAIQSATGSTPRFRIQGMLNRPVPVRGQEPPANSNADWVADHVLAPPAGHHRGYCETNSSELTGLCAAYNYANTCSVGRSAACPRGQKPKKPGYYQCSLMQKIFVDLGRSCAF